MITNTTSATTTATTATGGSRSAAASATTASEKAAAAKKLAFSVENILDPTKFCRRQELFGGNGGNATISGGGIGGGHVGWPDGFDGTDRMDDDHSDSHSG